MTLGRLSQLAVIIVAIAVAMLDQSFWWSLIPAFFAGSFQVTNGPNHAVVMNAHREGRLDVFPLLLLINILPWVAAALGVYYGATYLLI
jgi:hypothetical protein